MTIKYRGRWTIPSNAVNMKLLRRVANQTFKNQAGRIEVISFLRRQHAIIHVVCFCYAPALTTYHATPCY